MSASDKSISQWADMNQPAKQAEPPFMIQSPPIYKLPFGDAQIILVSDGTLALGSPEKSFRGISKKEIDAQLSRHFLPTDNIVIEETVLVLMSGGKRILFETGTGFSPLYPRLGIFKQAWWKPASIPHRSTLLFARMRIRTMSGAFPRPIANHSFRTRKFTSARSISTFGPTQSYLGRHWMHSSPLRVRISCPCVTGSCSFKMGRSFCLECRLCSLPDIPQDIQVFYSRQEINRCI